jgi:hypothetical protein
MSIKDTLNVECGYQCLVIDGTRRSGNVVLYSKLETFMMMKIQVTVFWIMTPW